MMIHDAESLIKLLNEQRKPKQEWQINVSLNPEPDLHKPFSGMLTYTVIGDGCKPHIASIIYSETPEEAFNYLHEEYKKLSGGEQCEV